MTFSRLLAPTLSLMMLSGCALSPDSAPVHTFYDSTVHNHRNQAITLTELARELAPADVVIIGEFHGHQGAHLLQARLQAALHQQRPDQVLVMEAFETDTQPAIDRYLAGELGESELIEDARGWENYRGSYRPLMEYARHHGLPVRAANAPVDLVRCVGQQGKSYVGTLEPEHRQALPDQPFPQVAGYRERFFDQLQGEHASEDGNHSRQLENTYQAQLLRDSTMAATVLDALNEAPRRQALMIVGSFHSDQRQGMVAILEQLTPQLEVRVLTPVLAESDTSPEVAAGDYWYQLWPLPTRFHDVQRERNHLTEAFRNRPTPDCGPATESAPSRQ